jgi:hypothetical protein
VAAVCLSMDRVAPNLGGSKSCDDADEGIAQLVGPAATAPAGVVPLSGGVAEACRCLSCSRLVWLMSLGESLDPLDRRDGGVLDVVPLLGASRLETWQGGPGAFLRCSPLSEAGCKGAMHAIAVIPKTMSSLGCSSSAISPFLGALTRRALLDLLFFGGV